ncbi:MAG: TolC family protein, partial [Bdellovibrionota bacterium]
RSDFMQADAAVKLRGLELQAALDEERAALDQFETLRGRPLATYENLQPIESAVAPKLLSEIGEIERADLKAAEEVSRAARANSRMGLERVSPTLEAYANLVFNGKDAATGPAIRDSFKTNHPTYTFGVRFSAPIDLPATFSAREGHHLDVSASERSVERKRYEVDREWKSLVAAYAEARARLALTEGIEKVQREKLELERDRQVRGRSTTYQVLAFEQDYATAELLNLRSKVDVLKLQIQARLFARSPPTSAIGGEK